MFSDIAPSYDRLNRLLSFSMDRLWRRRAVGRARVDLEDGRSARLLDVCTGTGDLAWAFARQIRGVRAVGLDLSREMLRVAEGKKGGKRRSGAGSGPPPSRASVEWVQGDGLHLPFADGCFDAVSIAFGLRNFVDPQAGLAEMRRVARTGGRVVILEFGPDPRGWIAPLYRFYLARIVPRVGNLLTRSKAYDYLADTIRGFAQPETVLEWMRAAGLDETMAEPLTGGIVFVYSGVAS